MKKKDDEFFDDLDKTTDLLKAFKPRVEKEESNDEDLRFLYEDTKKVKEVIAKKEVKHEPKKETKQEVKKVEPVVAKKQDDNKTEISNIIDKMNTTVLENKKQVKKKEIKEVKEEVKKTKKKKDGFLEIIFCTFSALFIIGCICVYASRLVKYYKIYNPKNDSGEVLSLLTTEIIKDSPIVYEGSGLYMQGGDRVYKGEKVNNYIKYSNLTWRILKVSTDGTIDIILDEYVNALPFSKDNIIYQESDINDWLNNEFIKFLDQDYLVGSKVCTDVVNDLNSYTCNKFNNDNKVRLLSISEFLNSKADNTTFISDTSSTLWLHTVADKGVWQVNGTNLSIANQSRALSVKPVVTLKVGVAHLSGTGTNTDPYKIQKDSDKITIGDYVKLGNDVYVVYNDQDNKLYLALNNTLPSTYRFDLSNNIYSLDNKYSLAYYLNNNYYNSLTYKDLLIDNEWNVGAYNSSYKDISSAKLSAKVGLLSLNDLKFNNTISDYFMLNGTDNGVYLYSNELVVSKPAISRRIRPCIVIESVSSKSGNGTIDSPYIVEG